MGRRWAIEVKKNTQNDYDDIVNVIRWAGIHEKQKVKRLVFVSVFLAPSGVRRTLTVHI